MSSQEAEALKAYAEAATHEAQRLDEGVDRLGAAVTELRTYQADRDAWLRDHPGVVSRQRSLDRELDPFSEIPTLHQELSSRLAPLHEPQHRLEVDHGTDLGIDIGL